jgi:hypothetical protein
MASFFALNIAEFVRNGDGSLSLGYVSKIMCMTLTCPRECKLHADVSSSPYHGGCRCVFPFHGLRPGSNTPNLHFPIVYLDHSQEYSDLVLIFDVHYLPQT